MALKINENLYKEVSERLIEHIKDPNSNLEDLRNKLNYLDNYGDNIDTILGLDMSKDAFGIAFLNIESGKMIMVGGLVRHRDGSYGVHT